jgi:glycerol-3-phosphate dehydrogenase
VIHSGYNEENGSVRAKFCASGNQMFADLDRELRFGYNKNGSLVIAFTQEGEQTKCVESLCVSCLLLVFGLVDV